MRIELGTTDWKLMAESASAKVQGVHESMLQESEKDVLWYRDNFLGKGIPRLAQWLANHRFLSPFQLPGR